MGKLEKWQRYSKASSCPICGGYGAYKPEHRCKGFRTADGRAAFCSQVEEGSVSSRYFAALDTELWKHLLDEERGGVLREVSRKPEWA